MCKQDRINLKNNDDENQFSLNKKNIRNVLIFFLCPVK